MSGEIGIVGIFRQKLKLQVLALTHNVFMSFWYFERLDLKFEKFYFHL